MKRSTNRVPNGYKRRGAALVLATKPQPTPYQLLEIRVALLEGTVTNLEARLLALQDAQRHSSGNKVGR